MDRPSTKWFWSSTDPVTYTVAVDAVYEGDVGSVAVFESAVSSASCGLDGMVVDRRYLFFTTMDGNVPTASLCGGTGPATPKRLKAVERVLGTPTPPAEVADAVPTTVEVRPSGTESPAAPGVSGWAVGGGLAAGAVLLAAGLRLRRSS